MYTQSLYGIEISVPHKLWYCVGIHNIKKNSLGSRIYVTSLVVGKRLDQKCQYEK
jgi:hypothetical protein